MNFDYDRIAKKEDHGNQWVSYSDLFMVLSFLFLLLYTVASFRSGAISVQSNKTIADKEEQIRQLEAQVQVFERLRNNYLEVSATQQEKKIFDALMNRLDTLKEKTQQDEATARAELKELAEKNKSLDFYQNTVKSLITAHLSANAKINERDQRIDTQTKEIGSLSKTVKDQEQTLTKKERLIAQTSDQLRAVKSEFEKERVDREEQQKAFSERLSKIVKERDEKVSSLSQESTQRKQALNQSMAQMEALKTDLNQAQKQNENLINELTSAQNLSQKQIDQIKGEHLAEMQRQEGAFKDEIAKQKLNAAERAAAENMYKDRLAKSNAEHNAKLKDLEGGLAENNKRLAQLVDAGSALTNQNAALNSQLQGEKDRNKELDRELALARAKADRRKNISKRISDAFRGKGIDVEVNPNTGDVILNFGDEYFDTGKHLLKPGMAKILRGAIPKYAETLLDDTKIASQISSIEIIGFSSPTYKDRVVDPNTLSAADRGAVNYNLDLSYMRARSIFKYIFDQSKMQFKQQKQLLPLVKVTGRSFFTEDIKGQDPGVMNLDSFCKSHNCSRSQRVIIRFSLQD